ncbi:hypothetical protein [Brucella intermedia]|uniref:hypothetical protein n=1 Tax=Brucella intermedia TaxID=94625 RepID=UPI00235F6BAF|nr:hypothetical protein [Brucella intermedia]
MGAKRMRTSRQQLIEEPATLADQQENEPGARGERERALEEAVRNAAMYLATGFITCPRCGEDVETKNTDAEYTLRAALSSPDHADAGKVEGDGWLPSEYEVYCDDELVAASNDLREAMNYAAINSGDGFVELVEVRRRPLPTAPSQEVA